MRGKLRSASSVKSCLETSEAPNGPCSVLSANRLAKVFLGTASACKILAYAWHRISWRHHLLEMTLPWASQIQCLQDLRVRLARRLETQSCSIRLHPGAWQQGPPAWLVQHPYCGPCALCHPLARSLQVCVVCRCRLSDAYISIN